MKISAWKGDGTRGSLECEAHEESAVAWHIGYLRRTPLVTPSPDPALVYALSRKGALTSFGRGLFAMPGAEGLRLPVARRSADAYRELIESCGFSVTTEDLLPDERTPHEKPGMKVPLDTSMALLLECARL